jgi:diguanylate cyclase (GGDEF)-like protein/PAS domain S-box-containing protein
MHGSFAILLIAISLAISLTLYALLGKPLAAPRIPLDFPVTPPVLSLEERVYLERLSPIKFCVDNDWEPYEKVDSAGAYTGIAAELLRLIAARTGVELELLRTKNWSESLAASRAGDCLLLAFLNETPERREWLAFSDPYFSDPNVFITRADHEFIADPAGLTDKTIVFPSGTSLEEIIRSRYPNLQILVVESELEALKLVEDGKADMTLRSLTMAAYVIRKEGHFNLRISGQLPEFSNEFRIGVAKDETLLRDILNRGVRSISPQEVQAIINSHIAIEARTTLDRRPFFWTLGALFFVSLAWTARNLSLQRHMKHLRLIIDTVPAFIFAKDYNGRYLLANRWMATAFGVEPEAVEGLTDLDCHATEAERAAYIEQDRKVMDSGKAIQIDEHPGRRVDGSPGWFQTIKVPYRQPGARGEAILGVTTDITELKLAGLELEERERRFRHMAQHDGLTGLPNRALFTDRLEQALASCRRERIRLAFAFVDLDRFKEINDGLGHAVGDSLLKEAAARMKRAIRNSDTIGRIGGDEFVAFFPGVEDREAAFNTADKLRAALEQPFDIAGAVIKISASLGVALFPDDGEEELDLARCADAAMYRSKAQGRNRVSVYDPAADDGQQARSARGEAYGLSQNYIDEY